jgi:OOP family OmpA-OmpF porin
MTRKFSLRRRLVAASLLIWGCAGLLTVAATAEDAQSPPPGSAEATTIADQSDTPPESAAAQAAAGDVADAGRPGEVAGLRNRVEAAETQIQLLKSVVVQALRAQSAAEAALRRERGARDAVSEGGGIGARELMLSDQLEALTDNLKALRADVAALRAPAVPDGQPTPEPTQAVPVASSFDVIAEAKAAPAAELETAGGSAVADADDPLVDAPLPDNPLIEDQPAAFPADDAVQALDDQIEVGIVHFNPGSADLTPGARRKTLEALERIKAMEPAKVRVVGYADTMGDAGYNRRLSSQRARSIANLLEQVGLAGGGVEIVGNGEDGVPEPTDDQISEPLNRCAGIFVVMDSPK